MTYDEPLLIRTNGGPNPGTRLAYLSKFGWPLPDTLQDINGKYVKHNESKLGPVSEGSHVIRGAEYKWEEDTNGRYEEVSS